MSQIEQTINTTINYSSTSNDVDGIITHNDHAVSAAFIMSGSTGPTGKEMQDAHSISNGTTANGIKFTITVGCDGHGFDGKAFANTTVNELPPMILAHIDEIIVFHQYHLFSDIFEKFNELLCTRFESSISGGTTCTVVIKFHGGIICANLADFDVITQIDTPNLHDIVFFKDGVLQKVTSNILMMTEDHSPHSLSEASRLLDMGCEIKYASADGSYEVDAYNVETANDIKTIRKLPWMRQKGAYTMNMSGDIAIYIHRSVSKFNLSRSFGDFKAGFISPKPSISVVYFPRDTPTKTIMGSDGYFNCFTTEQLHGEFKYDPHMICERGYETVGKTFGHKNADNTTIIVLT